MPGIATSEHVVKITVVKVGQDKEYIEVPAGSAGSHLLKAFGGEGRRVTIGGEDVTADTTVEKDTQAFVGPRSVKQGL